LSCVALALSLFRGGTMPSNGADFYVLLYEDGDCIHAGPGLKYQRLP
jgi:hypothetical protein